MPLGSTVHPCLHIIMKLNSDMFAQILYTNITKLQMIHLSSMEMSHLIDLTMILSIRARAETIPAFFALMSTVITEFTHLVVVKHGNDECCV